MCNANTWFFCRDAKFAIEGMFWRMTKKEILELLERKEQDFA
jgi:hypothetical protein